MKKIILTITIALLSNLTFGQDKLQTYYPNGELYPHTGKTLEDVNFELEEHGRVYMHIPKDIGEGTFLVGFKLFTNTPLWVATRDKTRIQSAIDSFELDEFLQSYKFEMELENYIEKGTLTDLYILETLGPPDNRDKYFDKNIQVENWTYTDLGIKLTIENGAATSYIKID